MQNTLNEEDESNPTADTDATPDPQSGDAEPAAPSAAAQVAFTRRQPAPPPAGAGGHASRSRRSRRAVGLRVSKAGGYRSEDSDDELAVQPTPPLRKAVSCDRLQNARQMAEDAIRVRLQYTVYMYSIVRI